MNSDNDASVVNELQLREQDISEFLRHLSTLGEKLFDGGGAVLCGLTSRRHNGKSLIAGSAEAVVELNEIQCRVGEGPAQDAMAAGKVVVVEDAHTERRWPDYFGLAAHLEFASILAVPLQLNAEGVAALTFYAKPRNFFTAERQQMVSDFAGPVGRTLELAMRLARHEDTSSDLLSAMRSRTSIDIAIGILIAQNRCTQEEAFTLLRRASNNRNLKVREVAEALIVQAAGKAAITHFMN